MVRAARRRTFAEKRTKGNKDHAQGRGHGLPKALASYGGRLRGLQAPARRRLGPPQAAGDSSLRPQRPEAALGRRGLRPGVPSSGLGYRPLPFLELRETFSFLIDLSVSEVGMLKISHWCRDYVRFFFFRFCPRLQYITWGYIFQMHPSILLDHNRDRSEVASDKI